MSEENIETTENISTPTLQSLGDLKPKMKIQGVVKHLELYGAFIDIGVDVNALIHISRLGKEHVNRVSDVLAIGDEVSVWVDKIDLDRKQVMVTMIEPLEVEWSDLKPEQIYTGKIVRLENYGAFVDIGAEREGLVHISELSHGFIKHPREVLTVGNEIDVMVLGFNKRKRRIDLSIKALLDKPEPVAPAAFSGPDTNGKNQRRREKKRRGRKTQKTYEVPLDLDSEDELPTAMEIAMRKALGSNLPTPSKSTSRKRRQKKARAQQEDIISRTLQMQQEG